MPIMRPTKILIDTPPERAFKYAKGIETASITKIAKG